MTANERITKETFEGSKNSLGLFIEPPVPFLTANLFSFNCNLSLNV
jgi:hypothetical protein